jgi:hypothetical protein
MRLPRRLNEILKKKEAFLDELRSKFEGTALKLQTNLFEDIMSDIIPGLDVKDGVLLDNAHNYRLISELNRVYGAFEVKAIGTILPQINTGIEGITTLNTTYFSLAIPNAIERFDKIIEGVKVITDLKIGLRTGKMIRGGYLMSTLKTDAALTELKQLLLKLVTSQVGMKEFINAIKENVNGTDLKSGVYDRQLKRYAYDTYQQYDAAYNKKLAEEFGMKYFIYQGGIIKDSRDFCVCHNDKVFSIEESELWKTWTPQDCTDYPEGWPKQKDLSEHPGYMDYPGYDPMVDRGGYNCRHILGFMSDELAQKLRPDILTNNQPK